MTITLTHTSETGTLVEGSVKGDGVWDVLKPRGWGYSRDCGIYLGQSRDRAPKYAEIEAAASALRAAGHEVTVTIDAAPRSAELVDAEQQRWDAYRADRMDERADRHQAAAEGHWMAYRKITDNIPLGQPILVGHHSEARARGDIRRIDRHIEHAANHAEQADTARAAAEAARPRAEGPVNVGALRRRIASHETTLRDLDRRINGGGTGLHAHRPATGDYREQLLVQQEHATERLSGDRAKLSAAEQRGAKVWRPEDFDRTLVKAGRVMVTAAGVPLRVHRVNAKSLTVDHWFAELDTMTLPYDKVTALTVLTED